MKMTKNLRRQDSSSRVRKIARFGRGSCSHNLERWRWEKKEGERERDRQEAFP